MLSKSQATPRERIVWLGMGSALTTVTFSMIAVGIIAVRWLAGGSGDTPIVSPTPQPAVTANEGTGESPAVTSDAEFTPLVLTPNEGTPPRQIVRRPDNGPTDYSTPDWSLPTTDSVRTAKPPLGSRYR